MNIDLPIKPHSCVGFRIITSLLWLTIIANWFIVITPQVSIDYSVCDASDNVHVFSAEFSETPTHGQANELSVCLLDTTGIQQISMNYSLQIQATFITVYSDSFDSLPIIWSNDVTQCIDIPLVFPEYYVGGVNMYLYPFDPLGNQIACVELNFFVY